MEEFFIWIWKEMYHKLIIINVLIKILKRKLGCLVIYYRNYIQNIVVNDIKI